MPLTMVGVGESRPIIRIGGSDKVRTHLENLGFVEGEMVRVVSDISGNLIVQVKDARVAISRELADMGITKGVQIYVRKVAPLGDPVEVTVRGYELSLRKADADLIEVK